MAHIVIVLLIAGWSGFRGCQERPPDIVMPVDFMVNVAPDPVSVEQFLPPEPREVVEPAPEPEPEPVPQPKPKPKRKPIKVSRKRVVKNLDRQKPQPKRLSDEEIRKRLEMEAQRGNRDTLPPDEEALGFEMVRRAMYAAWNQPTLEEVGDSVAGVTLRLDGTGKVLSAGLDDPSGNATMDASVQQALLVVSRIDGLSAGFLSRHKVITVKFKVE